MYCSGGGGVSIKMKWAKTTGAFDICNMSVVLPSPAYSTCRKTSLKLLQYDTRVSTQRVSRQFINKIPRRRIKTLKSFYTVLFRGEAFHSCK